MTKLRNYFWVLEYTKKCRFSWLFSHIFPIVTDFLSVYFDAMCFKYLFMCFEHKSFNYLYIAVAFAVGDLVLAASFGALFKYLRVRASAIITSELKKALLAKVLVLPLGRLENEHSGQVMARFNQDVDVAVSAVDNILDKILLPAVLGLGCLVVVFLTIWELGVFYTVVMLPIILMGRLFAKRFRRTGKLVQERLATFNERFTDILSGAAVIKQFSVEELMRKKGEDAAEGVFEARKKEINLNAVYKLSANLFSHAFVTFPIILGCLLVAVGRAVLPDVMFLSRYTYQIRQLVTMITTFSSELQFQLAAADRLKEVFDTDEEGINSGAAAFEESDSMLRTDHVSVSYGDTPVLNRVSVAASLGETVALVGASGSGKSTLLKAILRFAEFDGRVEMFGNNTKDLNLSDLRDRISYVSQDYDLFDGTIYENISYGKLAATRDEVLNAAKISCCHDFAEQLTDKYETRVGENGSNLSGGQRQRVSIARAVLKDSPVLILDEAMSALDYELENRILANLRQSGKEQLVIICTHRLSTIMNASRIYVLNQGEVVQSGTHRELLSREGIYKDFFELQSGGSIA